MKNIKIPALGYELAADWYEGDSNEVLLSLVGYTSSKAKYTEIINSIVEQTNCSVLVVDYSGHGESPLELRDTSPAQHFLEAITAFDWLKTNYPNKIINVMGSSYGGFLATQLTKYRDFNKLVLRVPAIYQPKNFYTKWGPRIDDWPGYRKVEHAYRKNKSLVNDHPIFRNANKYKGRVLVVVHENDELVPRETTDVYIEKFQAKSYLAKGFSHSFNKNGSNKISESDRQQYRQEICDFLKK